MGVLREDKNSKPPQVPVESGITYADYVFDDLTDDEDVVVVVEVEHSEEEEDLPPVHRLNYERRMSRRNAKHNAQKAIREANTRMTMYPNAEMDVKKRLSAQKQRRIEHARILAQFADANDIRFDCTDLVEETVSAFARLMQNEKAMRAWNEFVECSDEDQEKFLRELGIQISGYVESASSLDDLDVKIGEEGQSGCSAKTSFQRLDKKFKTALSKKNGVRLELIEKLENEFRKFFGDNPTERFYLHAVAQFLMLQSNTAQETVTQVHNPRKKFLPPSDYLHSYLRKKLSKNAY